MAVSFLERSKHYKYIIAKNFKLIKFKADGEPILAALAPDDRERISKEIIKFTADLNQKTDQEIYDMYHLLKSQEKVQRKVIQDDEYEFYNKDEAKEGYSKFWLLETITIQEGVALLLRRNPEIVTFESMSYYRNHNYPLVNQYFEYIEYCKRHFVPTLNTPQYRPHQHRETQITHMQIETPEFIKYMVELGLQEEIELGWLKKIEAKNQTRLTIGSLEAENSLLREQLKQANTQVEGIRLTEIRDADCLSTKMQHILLASVNLWVAYKNGKLKNVPKEEDIIKLLTTKDFSPALAKSAATIIKPDWIPKGRPKKV